MRAGRAGDRTAALLMISGRRYTKLDLFMCLFHVSLLVFYWGLVCFHPDGNTLKILQELCCCQLHSFHCQIHQLWATHNITILVSGLTYGFHANSLSLSLSLSHSHPISSSVFSLSITCCLTRLQLLPLLYFCHSLSILHSQRRIQSTYPAFIKEQYFFLSPVMLKESGDICTIHKIF